MVGMVQYIVVLLSLVWYNTVLHCALCYTVLVSLER